MTSPTKHAAAVDVVGDEALRYRATLARLEVQRICHGPNGDGKRVPIRICIPAQPEDTDVIIDDVLAEIPAVLDRLAAAETECLEQCRLLGISGSREAQLLAQLAASEKRAGEYRKALELVFIVALPPHDVSGSRMFEEARQVLADPQHGGGEG